MIPSFSKALLAWYRQHRRDLPWRRTSDPYRILVSEVMLQQTQVATVIPYYERFLKSFPTFNDLAKAPLDSVLKHWEGLGYYSRARNLHNLASTVRDAHQGSLPNDPEVLSDLPGIGRYTAGAVLSIAFKKDFPVVDGNVQRVLARYFAYGVNIKTGEAQRWFWAKALELLPKGHASDFNQGLMELGATICVPRNPLCLICPVSKDCAARIEDRIQDFPVKTAAKPTPHFNIGAGVIWRKDRLLITQRPLKGLLGGLWEFPGGKVEEGESLQDCVSREILEEVGVRVAVGKKMMTVKHAYSHFRITLHAFSCTFKSGKPQKIACKDFRWVLPSELANYAFPSANQPILRAILEPAPDRGQNSPTDAA